MDKRLVDMPRDLSEEQRSDHIKDKCKLEHEMWSAVLCKMKKASNVSWKCKGCRLDFVGGPQKIIAHLLERVTGCKTCTVLKPEHVATAERCVAEELRLEELRQRAKKRKETLAAAKVAEQSRTKQIKITAMAGTDLTSEGLDRMWAKVVYEAPTSMNFVESKAFVEAVEATSRFMLSEQDKKRLGAEVHSTEPLSCRRAAAGSDADGNDRAALQSAEARGDEMRDFGDVGWVVVESEEPANRSAALRDPVNHAAERGDGPLGHGQVEREHRQGARGVGRRRLCAHGALERDARLHVRRWR